MVTIEKLGKLRFWCQKVLPLVYDDSLSYYELLNKVVKYLNDHTTVINTLVDEYSSLEEIIIDALQSGLLLEQLANALGFVTPEMYGAVGDGVNNDSEAIQQALDSGYNIMFKGETIYHVEKLPTQVGYDNDEPCCYLKDKENLVINGNGATLKTNKHGQGIFEVINCKNIEITNLNVEGYGEFPSIEPYGRGEKGTSTQGYYQSGYYWEAHKNNQIDTSNYTGINGNTDAVWGTFGDGYICNIAIGFLAENGCENISFINCSAKGFNYAGFMVGFLGHNNLAKNRNIKILNCNVKNCYDSGIRVFNCDGINVDNCMIEDIGHPDARKNVGTVYPYQVADPGYGFTVTSVGTDVTKSKNIKLTNSTIKNCVRKGVDSHGASLVVIDSNYIYNALVAGIEFSGGETTPYLTDNAIINSNIIEYCGGKGHGINVYQYTGSDVDNDNFTVNVIVSNNILHKCACITQGILYVRAGRNAKVINNIISDKWNIYDISQLYGIFVGAPDENMSGVIVDGNTIEIDAIYCCIISYNNKNGKISNNLLRANVTTFIIQTALEGFNANSDVCNNVCVGENSATPIISINGEVFNNKINDVVPIKILKDTFTVNGGYIALSDPALKATSLLFIQLGYNAVGFTITNIQTFDGRANVYVRLLGGTLPPNGTNILTCVLIINN